MSQNELGAFLRSRREAVTPAEVGLPGGTRRRTPGLRRAELATLAGVSVEYLARLEQGRDRNPSAQVLGALSEALRLTGEERQHLRRLVKAYDSSTLALCPSSPPPPSRTVRPTVRTLLDQLEPSPAALVNRIGDLLAYTSGYEQLARPLGLLDADPPNLTRYVFTDERARAAYPEWERMADEQIAGLKTVLTLHDPHAQELCDELTVTAGRPFADRLESVTDLPRRTGVERLSHPGAGELRLAYEILGLPDADDQHLIVHLPADDATSAALDRLTGRQPGALRVVSG
ncbi:XRE family transcriptional regulator [Streptomyces armeniacus]|uniref:XRE family transcriptional regulator n=1 Tax=Streptomyces armeniacus TaxID=83291 RepID=A0A345Y1U3_9ACTN|nr:helix-turn-helix transcriptional regulator [Streptomyces armeniacus]AXK37859.1 XRE family transcriptional regulator [Streptomyces armeniacus]